MKAFYTLLAASMLLPTVTSAHSTTHYGHDNHCREFSETIHVGKKKEKIYGTACKQTDGSWRIMDNHATAAHTPDYHYPPRERIVVRERPVYTPPFGFHIDLGHDHHHGWKRHSSRHKWKKHKKHKRCHRRHRHDHYSHWVWHDRFGH